LGQSGFLIRADKTFVIIDAYLSSTADRKAGNGSLEWKRRYPAPVSPEKLDFINIIICSHDHKDHLDLPTLQVLSGINPDTLFIAPAPTKQKILSLGVSLPNAILQRATAVG